MANMEAKAAELIHRWNMELAQPVSLHVVRGSDERGAALSAFLHDFAEIAQNVRISPQDGNDDELPAILLGNSVHWHAIPEGGELMPFLKTVEMQLFPMRARACLPEELRSQIESLSVPADLKIYVTPQCPFCPRVLSEIVPLAFINPLVRLSVIDGALFPDLAAGDGIRSVPTIILDGAFRWTGAGHIDEIVHSLLNRDPACLGAKTFIDFLKGGNAEALAQMMIDHKQVFPAFIELLEHSDWSVRLGAMVVVEEIAEKNPELTEEMLNLLWKRLDRISGPARGDIISLIGFANPGSKLWIERLKGVLADADADAGEGEREAVLEALEKLCRHRGSLF